MSQKRLRRFGWLLGLVALAGCAAYPPHVDTLLNATDRKLVVEAAQAALEKNRTGEATNWKNPATGARGTVTPVQTYKSAVGSPCRDYQVTVTVRGKTHVAGDTACRLPAGNWKSVNHAGLAGARVFEGMTAYLQDGRYVYAPPPPYPYDYPYGYPYGYPYPYPYYGPRLHFGFGYYHNY